MSTYVYRAFNADGVLLYVGCSYDLGDRLRAHYLQTPWWFSAKRWTFTAYRDDLEAQAAERLAIQTEMPRWNVRDRSPDHPDGFRITRRDIARLYPEDDRQLTHGHLRVIYEGQWNRARLVDRRAA